MAPEIAQGNLGTVGKYDVAFTGGKLQVSASVSDGPISGGVNFAVDARLVVDAIFKKLPQNLITAEINQAVDAAIAAS